MNGRGLFGYIIGKKKRMMYVCQDTELMWQILVREIYILMRHFGSKDALRAAFEKIQVVAVAKNKPPNQKEFEHCKLFADFSDGEYWKTGVMEWSSLLRHCQNSFINLLEAGYILQSVERSGNGNGNGNGSGSERVFLIDFNKGCVNYYMNYKGVGGGGLCKKELNKATLEEIMGFEDMPARSYSDIVCDMAEKFAVFYQSLTKIRAEIEKLLELKRKARGENALNIEDKVDKLLDDMYWEEKQLHMCRRVFYHRLKAIDLIEDV
jgi:hypothetical protein